MTRDEKIEYEMAISCIKPINFDFEYKTVKAIRILIEEYRLYYNGADEKDFHNIEASKTLSKVLERYVVLEHIDTGRNRGYRVAYSTMPERIEKALQQKAQQVLDRRNAKAVERNNKMLEEINSTL
jgi:hypothetical protein